MQRLAPGDRDLARRLFAAVAAVFAEDDASLAAEPLGDRYLDRLLGREDFWAFAALAGDEVVGGLTAHTLPMTRAESAEVFIYDVAVRAEYRRRGVGRRLVEALRAAAGEAGIEVVFVPADDEDAHALDFYRALGGAPAVVTIFTFEAGQP